MGLEVTVELLQGWVLEVPEIEVVDCEIVDEKFGDLHELAGNVLWFADSLLACEVDDVFSEGQDDHVEAGGSLEVIFLIVFLLLGEEGRKSELLVVPGH